MIAVCEREGEIRKNLIEEVRDGRLCRQWSMAPKIITLSTLHMYLRPGLPEVRSLTTNTELIQIR